MHHSRRSVRSTKDRRCSVCRGSPKLIHLNQFRCAVCRYTHTCTNSKSLLNHSNDWRVSNMGIDYTKIGRTRLFLSLFRYFLQFINTLHCITEPDIFFGEGGLLKRKPATDRYNYFSQIYARIISHRNNGEWRKRWAKKMKENETANHTC